MTGALLPASRAPVAARIATSGLLARVVLTLLWETVLAPLRPGAAWLALKAVPLAAVLPATLRGRRRARQIAALLLPWYIAEGIVRALTEHGRHALVAGACAVLGVVTFVALLAWLRAEAAA